MHARHTLSLLVVLGALGCGESHTSGEDAGPIPAEDAATGADAAGAHDGGSVLDAAIGTDAAATLDAAPAIDGGAFPTDCDGLGPAACLRAGCTPDFDDACCSTCEPTGGCADCTDLTYHSCQPYAAACLGGPSCGVAPPWGCGPAAPICEGATPTDLDSCDVVGCVPSYPSGTVLDESAATCVPITMNSCTFACRRLPPPCPEGTVAEADGSCFTDRCIPAFVCR